MPHSMWDLISNQDWSFAPPALGAQSLNHWLPEKSRTSGVSKQHPFIISQSPGLGDWRSPWQGRNQGVSSFLWSSPFSFQAHMGVAEPSSWGSPALRSWFVCQLGTHLNCWRLEFLTIWCLHFQSQQWRMSLLRPPSLPWVFLQESSGLSQS